MTEPDPDRMLSVVKGNLERLPELTEDDEGEMFTLGLTALATFAISVFRRTNRQRTEWRRRDLERRNAFEQGLQQFDEWDQRNRPWPPPMVRVDAPEPPGWETSKWQWPRPARTFLL